MERGYLCELRAQHNESQQDVADALRISRQYYSLIEDGSRQKRMDITLATAIANHFKIPVTSIIEEEKRLFGEA